MHLDSYLVGVLTILVFLIVEILFKVFTSSTVLEDILKRLKDKEDK